MKLKWKVQPAPTGPYRSFHQRGWPALLTPAEMLAAVIRCEDDYVPAFVKTGNHKELSVVIYDHTNGMQQRKVLRLKKTFTNLGEAKEAAEAFLAKHPECLPEEEV